VCVCVCVSVCVCVCLCVCVCVCLLFVCAEMDEPMTLPQQIVSPTGSVRVSNISLATADVTALLQNLSNINEEDDVDSFEESPREPPVPMFEDEDEEDVPIPDFD